MRIIIISILVSWALGVHGQVDKVFLRNGSLMKGELQGIEISDTLTLAIDSFNVLIPIDLVDEIHLRRKSNFDLTEFVGLGYPKGWSTGLAFGVSMGRSSSNAEVQTFPSFSASQLYHFHSLVNLGLNMGFLRFQDFDVFPIGLEYNLHLGKSTRNVMFYSVIGKSFAKALHNSTSDVDTEGGLFIQAGVGWQYRLGRNVLQYRLGYQLQDVDQTVELGQNYFVTNSRRLNRVTVQVSYRFHYK